MGSTQSTWGVTFFSETLSGDFLFHSLVKENGINIVHCHVCHLIGMFVDESYRNNRLGHSLCQRGHQGHQRAQAVSLSWAGRTPLATTKICLEITKSWGWVLPRSEAASSPLRLLGTRMSRRQQLLLQCMESHSLTLRVLEWIPLRLL